MSHQKVQNVVVHLFWFILATVICWGAVRLDLGAVTEPGPGFMPFLMGSLMFILAVVSLFESLKAGKANPLPGKGKLLVLALTMAALWLYAFLLHLIGFVLDTFLLMVFLFAVIQKVKWTTALVASFIAVSACYYLFSSLGTEFPRGILF